MLFLASQAYSATITTGNYSVTVGAQAVAPAPVETPKPVAKPAVTTSAIVTSAQPPAPDQPAQMQRYPSYDQAQQQSNQRTVYGQRVLFGRWLLHRR